MNNVEEEQEKTQENSNSKEEKEQSSKEENLQENEDIEEEEEDVSDIKSLPLPNATVVRLMRESLDPHKQIKSIVKKEMNQFLGKIIKIVCRKMNNFDYSYVDYGMFKQAIETFENIQTIELEKMRLIKSLEKIKADCDTLIDNVERKFHK